MTFVDDLHQQLLQRQSALVAEMKTIDAELDAVEAALRALEAPASETVGPVHRVDEEDAG